MRNDSFDYEFIVTLKDVNMYSTVYFCRYFEWQGICRERWFYECISADMLAPLGTFITKNAQQQYIQEIFAFQKVECEVSTCSIKQCSFSLLFKFFVDGKLVSKGSQQIVFTNKNKKITRLPESIIEKIRAYELHPDSSSLFSS